MSASRSLPPTADLLQVRQPRCSTPMRSQAPARADQHRALWGRCLLFAATTFCVTLLSEVVLEAASLHRRHIGLPGHAVALILTCGEFGGCCLLALICGGRFHDPPQAEGPRGSRARRAPHQESSVACAFKALDSPAPAA